MVYLTKGGFWMVLGQTVSVAITAAVAIAFANILTKEEYGTYKYVLSLAATLSAFSLTGMNMAIINAVAKGFDKTFIKSIMVQIKWSLPMFVISLGLCAYYFLTGQPIIGTSLIFVSIFSPFINAFNTYSAYLNGKKLFRKISFYSILISCFVNAAGLAVLIATNNIPFLVLTYFLANFAILGLILKRVIKSNKINQEEDNSYIGYGKHLSLIYFLSNLVMNIDKIFIFNILGPIQLAVYNFAIIIPEQIRGFIKILGTLAYPKFAQKTLQESKTNIGYRIMITFIAGGIIMTAYIIVAPYIFRIFLPKYLDSIFYSQIFAVSTIFSSVILILNAILTSHKETVADLYKINIFMAAVKIAVYFAAIYFFGLMGAIICATFLALIQIAITIFFLNKKPVITEESI